LEEKLDLSFARELAAYGTTKNIAAGERAGIRAYMPLTGAGKPTEGDASSLKIQSPGAWRLPASLWILHSSSPSSGAQA
jgi:hypothetical protein